MPINHQYVANVNTFGTKCLMMDLLWGVAENSRLDSKAMIIIWWSSLRRTTLLVFIG